MGFLRIAPLALRRWGVVVSALLLATGAVSVASASGAKIAEWEMNEGPNATTMHDSSGSNIDGKIGSAVVTDVVVEGRTGYRWPAIDHDVVDREHLITVNRSRLNPGRGDFAVIVRFNTGHHHHQHIMQKGNSGAAGGLWKMPIKEGKVGCFFFGSRDRAAIFSRETVVDGAWHTVRCERRRTGVSVIVDGGEPRTNPKWTGKIENTWPTSIGGKWFCRPPDIHCDYYEGLIDRIVVKRLR
jgi:laminin G domain protein